MKLVEDGRSHYDIGSRVKLHLIWHHGQPQSSHHTIGDKSVLVVMCHFNLYRLSPHHIFTKLPLEALYLRTDNMQPTAYFFFHSTRTIPRTERAAS